ncbi:MAG: hypothetical protein J3R72DRAFT_448294 [Linnemannia gamsii]|nr:MAG: hypothetical protein J3R72DRAFT_448294 [Linnemannia gamsii]
MHFFLEVVSIALSAATVLALLDYPCQDILNLCMPINSCAGSSIALPGLCPGSLLCCAPGDGSRIQLPCYTKDGRPGEWKPIITCTSSGGTPTDGTPPIEILDTTVTTYFGNFRCCVTPCKTNDGRSGNCAFNSTCSGTSIAGLCPGPSHIQCCLSGSSPQPLPGPFDATKVIAAARRRVEEKVPYSWGGGHRETPGLSLGTCRKYTGKIWPCPADTTIGLDCSGFVRDVIYRSTGIDLGRGNAASQSKNSHFQSIQYADRQPGDIAYYHSKKGKKRINHVVFYTGKNSAGQDMMIEAPETGKNIHEVPLRESSDWGGEWVDWVRFSPHGW